MARVALLGPDGEGVLFYYGDDETSPPYRRNRIGFAAPEPAREITRGTLDRVGNERPPDEPEPAEEAEGEGPDEEDEEDEEGPCIIEDS